MSITPDNARHYLQNTIIGFENELAVLNEHARDCNNPNEFKKIKESLVILLIQLGKIEQASTMVNLAERKEQKAPSQIRCNFFSASCICNESVEYLDKKGYAYCDKHAAQLQCGGRTGVRKLLSWEIEKLNQGETIRY